MISSIVITLDPVYPVHRSLRLQRLTGLVSLPRAELALIAKSEEVNAAESSSVTKSQELAAGLFESALPNEHGPTYRKELLR